MFSWVWSGFCEDEAEYTLSKALFMRYIRLPSVKEHIGEEEGVESITEFCRKSVFALERQTCYFHRRGIFHLESHCNSGHEGVNNGIKNCATPVQPSQKLDQATKTITKMQEMKGLRMAVEVSREHHDCKLWSKSPTSEHLTNLGEALVTQEFGAGKRWNHQRVDTHRWLVYHKDDDLSWDSEWIGKPSLRMKKRSWKRRGWRQMGGKKTRRGPPMGGTTKAKQETKKWLEGCPRNEGREGGGKILEPNPKVQENPLSGHCFPFTREKGFCVLLPEAAEDGIPLQAYCVCDIGTR